MNVYKGFLYIKLGRVGTRSEGPDYYLQTKNRDYELKFEERENHEPDYRLEFYSRRYVEITGKTVSEKVHIEKIKELPESPFHTEPN